MRLVTVKQMKAIEKQADASGLTYAQMMENAGQGLAEVIQDFDCALGLFGIVAGDADI